MTRLALIFATIRAHQRWDAARASQWSRNVDVRGRREELDALRSLLNGKRERVLFVDLSEVR